MGKRPSDESKGYWHLNPMGLAAGPLRGLGHQKELVTWAQADFANRKIDGAPKDGAFDNVPPTKVKSTWNRFLKALRLGH
jgi:hypothetical protein